LDYGSGDLCSLLDAAVSMLSSANLLPFLIVDVMPNTTEIRVSKEWKLSRVVQFSEPVLQCARPDQA
jgi:hypothetical protein